MNHRISMFTVTILLFVLWVATPISAQTDDCSAASFKSWINCEVSLVAGARLNQEANNKQPEAPTISDNSTSLVDQTAAPDLFGMAINLAGLSGQTNDAGKDKSSFSFTTSAFALYAAVIQRDPLDPAFYRRHPNLRRFYFTFGQENPDENGAVNTERATIIGGKFLVINRRDVSLPSNRNLIETELFNSGQALTDFLRITKEVQNYLYEKLEENKGQVALKEFAIVHLGDEFPALHAQLTPDQLDEIKDIISKYIESRIELDQKNLDVIAKIRNAPQLAFTVQSKLRKENGADEYRAGLAFDYGLNQRTNVTINGTFDYTDSKLIGGDKRGGRVAGETNFQLTKDRNPFGGTGPYLFTFSGEGKWLSNEKPTYTGQAKLTIPIFSGMTIPISVSLANRSELINETTVRGRVGFSFDFTKLFNGLR